MIETLLIATDGSEAAQSAERFACALASRLHARLLGLTVVEERVVRGLRSPGLGVAPPPLEALEGFLKARADAALKRLAETGRSSGLTVVCESVQGIVDDLIVERAQGVDLLVIGRDGEHAAFRTGLAGSTTEGVLRKTARSTLVVPSGAETKGPIVLSYDASPGSKIAARIAAELATRLSEPLHVFVDSKDKGRAAARFDEVRGLLGAHAASLREVSSTLGRPDVKLVEAATEVHASLIVMGAYGRNRMTELFLGSNAAAVVRQSKTAVLLAR
jgi:nucleotide-binding universal stress UspA family protein